VKIKASSYGRYNGGVKAKRAYGSNAVTQFYVYLAENEHEPKAWSKIEAKGPTPGDRKTIAIEYFRALQDAANSATEHEPGAGPPSYLARTLPSGFQVHAALVRW